MKEIQNMKKLFFTLLTFCSVMIWAGEAEIGKTVAHSVADWDAAGNGVTPEQGFRNWYFGYYDQVDKPETFQLIPQKGKQYWGDGNFTCGMISRDTIAWAGGSQKHNVVRRWVAPEDGNYLAEMEGTHTLKVKGELVTWPRKLYIYVNSKLRQTFSFPGKTVRKEAFAATLKKEDKLDFVSDAWGGGAANHHCHQQAGKRSAGCRERVLSVSDRDSGQRSRNHCDESGRTSSAGPERVHGGGISGCPGSPGGG